jgi:small subunit ribosomal protein S21
MLIINCNDRIDAALKKYRQKVKNTKLLDEVKGRRYFEKNSEKRRNTILKAKYRNSILSQNNEDI